MSNRIDTNVLRPRIDPDYAGPTAGSGDGIVAADRAQRALAGERLEAFFGNDGVGRGVDCTFKENHDFARCGTESVKNPVLFTQQPGDADPVDEKDVRQRSINDCHVMAAVAAMASTPDGKAAIKSMIREDKNERGEVVSYTVTLHKPEHPWLGLGKTTFSEVQVTVDTSFVKGHAAARENGEFNEVWSPVIEKAFATEYKGYSALNRAGSPALAMEFLTGKPVESFRLAWPSSYGPSELTAALSTGKLVVLRTPEHLPVDNAYQLVGAHAYALVGVKVVDGKACVLLQNPWGRANPAPVPRR